MAISCIITTSAHAQTLSDIQREAQGISTIRALIVYQDGETLYTYTDNNVSLNYDYNIKSASKSIIGLLTGIAIDQGFISSTEVTLGEFFPNYFESNPDSVKANITLHQMLTMQTGLETTSFHNYGRWVISKDWIRYALDQPIVEPPGEDMSYSTGTTHLLSAILTKETGMSTRSFARKYLFSPLGIRHGGWDRGPSGYYMGGNNLGLSPNDLLKIGQLVLNRGSYGGKQIIPEPWIERSLDIYTRSDFNPYDYGYLWWSKPVNGELVHFAWGFGGQYIFIIPELESVIVVTNHLEKATQERSYKEHIFNLLGEWIIPYLRSES